MNGQKWRSGLSALLSLGLCAACLPAMAQNAPTKPEVAPGETQLERMQNEIIAIVQQARPAVVSIKGHVPTARLFIRPRTPRAPRVNADKQKPLTKEEQKAQRDSEKAMQEAEKAIEDAQKQMENVGMPVTGSGFLLQGGFVVTTAEVTQGLRAASILTVDGKSAKVEEIHADRHTNVAVLKVSGIDAKMGLRWGDSDRVMPGSFTLMIGNQAGFPNSVALGMVAGINRAGRSGSLHYTNLIQFQGAVSGGGSGSPLLNTRGEVIGMIVATPANPMGNLPRIPGLSDLPGLGKAESDSGLRVVSWNDPASGPDEDDSNAPPAGAGNEPPQVFMFGAVSNTGFALPANAIRPIIERLQKGESAVVQRGWLGVRLTGTPQGARIERVYVGSPADRAGVQRGDLVTAVNGKLIQSARELRAMIANVKAGEAMRLTVKRGEKTLSLTLTIETMPDDEIIDKTPFRELPPMQNSFLVPDSLVGVFIG